MFFGSDLQQKKPEPFPARGKNKNAMSRICQPMASLKAVLVF